MAHSIIEQAQLVSNTLAQFKRVEKAVKELHSIRDGRASLTLSYLEIDQHKLEEALDEANKDLDEANKDLASEYTKLTYQLHSKGDK